MSYLDYWLAVDEWTFEEAALIFNSKDPDKYREQVNFSVDINRYKNSKWKLKVYHTHKIFKKVDWQKYAGEDPSSFTSYSEKVNHNLYFAIAADKQLKLPDALVAKWKEKQARSNSQKAASDVCAGNEQSLSSEMIKTLRPLIEVVESFANSEDFAKYGKDIQQQKIENWLKDKATTRDKGRVLKDLITRHYGIITARK